MKWNQPKYLNDIFRFKSNRRDVLLLSLREYFKIPESTFKKFEELFECLHFAVTTVDDIIDNETFRNNQPCYFVREGYDKSVIAAFSTFIRFLEIAAEMKVLNNEVFKSLRNMTISEEADAGLRKRDDKHFSPYEWYFEICSTKTSNEIAVILNTMNNYSSINNLGEVETLFFEIGRLAQFMNDKRDIIENSPLERFSKTDEIKLTYTLPLALYLEYVDINFELQIGQFIKQEDFKKIANCLSSEFIVKKVNDKINEQYSRTINSLKNNPALTTPKTVMLIDSIINGKFYKSKHHEIFSKQNS